MSVKTIGSVCSGIEAASVAWKDFGVEFQWFSEIADFPSQVLAEKYPEKENLGDMNEIPQMIVNGLIGAPDLICGGTPCQAFSIAGLQNGLNDSRGNLTLRFVDIIRANDEVRLQEGKDRCKVFWENVEGVLNDKTNAFGCLISSLAGLDEAIKVKGNKWPRAGFLSGPERNVAWRVLDAKFFGLPQQRKRLYLIAGGKTFHPENILFEMIGPVNLNKSNDAPNFPLVFEKDGHTFEVFREYTDCLYSAYGTKWNGNAAAYNGSLFVVQDSRIRRLSPLECERLMGFPDDYTKLPKAKKTNRYQVIGNSWAVPVVKWLGERIFSYEEQESIFLDKNLELEFPNAEIGQSSSLYMFYNDTIKLLNGEVINCSVVPENCTYSSMQDVISAEDVPDSIYISSRASSGILRRGRMRGIKMNERLNDLLIKTSFIQYA